MRIRDDKLPCRSCLKYAICLGRHRLYCKDLARWLNEHQTMESRATRINYFEEKVWNKDLSTINPNTGEITFKHTIRDHYSCMIVG